MKFNFEKHTKPTETELTDEQIQEKYEKDILAETEKLGTNLESLKSEIDALGGPEKFKEYFEKPVYKYDGYEAPEGHTGSNTETRGSYEIRTLIQKIKDKVSLTSVAATVSVFNFMNVSGLAAMSKEFDKNFSQYFSEETIQKIIHNFNNFSEQNTVDQVGMINGLLVSVIALSIQSESIYTGIKDAIEKRKLTREKAKQELKFKMTDTDIDKKFN